MKRYVSLLRGINVGGRIIKMADLKTCYEQAGCSAIKTVLQSGNVIFDSPLSSSQKVGELLEAAVGERFHYAAKILVLEQAELESLVASYPFTSADADYQHYIIFMRAGLAPTLAKEVAGLDSEVEAIAAGNNVIYWRVLKGMTLKSSFAKYLTKSTYKEFHTNRNINTVRKLMA